MANIKIAIFNLSIVLTDDQVKAAIPALQTQISRDFAPVWGIDGELVFVPHGTRPPQVGTKFDHLGKITAPLELLPDGYIGIFDLVGGGWTQLHPAGAQLTYQDRPRVDSRRERRRTPRDQWLTSTVETA